jgi:hypothetical protein
MVAVNYRPARPSDLDRSGSTRNNLSVRPFIGAIFLNVTARLVKYH